MKKNLLYLYTFLLIFMSCSDYKQQSAEVFYETDLDEFINPERGFYRPFGTMVSDFVPLNAKTLLNLRNPNLAAGGFNVASSLTYRSYQLDIFKDKAISEEVLNAIQGDMDIIRKVGNKIVLRFSYSNSCCDAPFNDAPKAIILKHLNQLKPILEKNVDVIAVVQMGLIGPWGEQYYSDYFGDLEHGPVTNQHWLDRSEVIDMLLEVVPESRMVQVRAPYYKLRYLDGKDALPENAKPLTEENAFNGTPIARLAHHNDCILANYDDYWTYNSFHKFPAVSDTLNLKKYIASETKYLVFGGETCPGGDNGEDVYSPYNDCNSEGGGAQTYLKRFHASFLNTSWSGAVNGDWANKCIDEIKRNLGYRFALKRGLFPTEIVNGKKINIQLDIFNEGYASTYNKRLVEFVLQNTVTQKIYKKKIETDPRYWFTGEMQTLNLNFKWEETLPKGNYNLYINLPDPEPTIYNRPEYAIRLAGKLNSKSIWNSSTGWNKLFSDIKVK
ncbi:DUF4832 domain-containing protein [Polaribacter sp. Z014]|uniref:DUF4832 domain-containing protein n=1 Tax=Polaribacter sp. Z014 TaxID=2927126 RepID=UPI00202085D4|nr:DUF4832 domain-containing protein [Polaribacter sp. Z014]MCL7762653.1 DUF4832 domain-containing protein [Polaribacter sp. Z014]